MAKKLNKSAAEDLAAAAKVGGAHYGNLRGAGARLVKLGLIEQKGAFMHATAAGRAALDAGQVSAPKRGKAHISIEGEGANKVVREHVSKKEAHAYGMALRRQGEPAFVHSAADAAKHGLDPRKRVTEMAQNDKTRVVQTRLGFFAGTDADGDDIYSQNREGGRRLSEESARRIAASRSHLGPSVHHALEPTGAKPVHLETAASPVGMSKEESIQRTHAQKKKKGPSGGGGPKKKPAKERYGSRADSVATVERAREVRKIEVQSKAGALTSLRTEQPRGAMRNIENARKGLTDSELAEKAKAFENRSAKKSAAAGDKKAGTLRRLGELGGPRKKPKDLSYASPLPTAKLHARKMLHAASTGKSAEVSGHRQEMHKSMRAAGIAPKLQGVGKKAATHTLQRGKKGGTFYIANGKKVYAKK